MLLSNAVAHRLLACLVTVAMKGRVACEMGQNELMITELVMRNILTDLQPAEIAALLSSLVFQAKTDVSPKLTETLEKVGPTRWCCLDS